MRDKIIKRIERVTSAKRNFNDTKLITDIVNKQLEEMQKYTTLKNMNDNEKYRDSYSYFLYDDFKEMRIGFKKLFDLCMIYNISMFDYLEIEVLQNNFYTQMLKKVGLVDNKIEFASVDTILEVVSENLTLHLISEHNEDDEDILPIELIKQILDTTCKVAKTELTDISNEYNTPREFEFNEQEVKEDLEAFFINLKDTISNKRAMAKREKSYLEKIIKNKLSYSREHKMFYCKRLKEGVSLGYSQRAFLFGVDKNKAIRELKKTIKILENFKDKKESEVLQKISIKLIELIKLKKHKEKIAYKTIAKKLNMTVNEARNFTKTAVNLNDKSFIKFYETPSIDIIS